MNSSEIPKRFPAFRKLARKLGASRATARTAATQRNASAQRSANQPGRVIEFKSFRMDRISILQMLNSIRDERLDKLETLKEQRNEFLDVLRNSVVMPVEDLQRTLQVYCEFRSNVIAMVSNLDELEEHLVRKLQGKV